MEFSIEQLKAALAEMMNAPIAAGRAAMAGAAQAMPTDPMLRPGVSEQSPEALPGGVDPASPEFQQRKRIAEALMGGIAPQR